MSRIIIYQVLPRLFGNDNEHCVTGGDKKQNGCGLLNDIDRKALSKIKELGVTHVWYTGLIEHATQTDYSSYGIAKDHSAIVKGKAGSPYAIKDYYDIDPDLASNPELRMQEFKALVERTHQMGLKVIMDFVPNHVARQYHSDHNPDGVTDLGHEDNPQQSFNPQNNFYYIPGTSLHGSFDMMGYESAPYQENPAKATGNDCFSASPGQNDWYETAKLNYGVDYCGGHVQRFVPTPSTWIKMLDILQFWAAQGIDGFRCDMAEMVPCDFWACSIPKVKALYPDLIFIGEVYNPSMYREYLFHGKFDYLYDKVGLYDTLRGVTCGYLPAFNISQCWKNVGDIQDHMLNFMENHDEQRIASDFFAGSGEKAKPAIIACATMRANPLMIYFGQEFGERGMDMEGFSGLDGRTTIFDYWSVPSICEWRKEHYQSSKLSDNSKKLYAFYKRLLHISLEEKAITNGLFFDVMYVNMDNPYLNKDKIFAYIRKYEQEAIFVVLNFSNEIETPQIIIPAHAFEFMHICEGDYKAKDLISGHTHNISLQSDKAFTVRVNPYSGIMLKITYSK